MNESQIKGEIGKAMRTRFPHWVVWRWEDRFDSGRPDFSFTGDGVTVWLEVKRDGGEPTKAQEEALRRLRQAGAYAGVLTVSAHRGIWQAQVQWSPAEAMFDSGPGKRAKILQWIGDHVAIVLCSAAT